MTATMPTAMKDQTDELEREHCGRIISRRELTDSVIELGLTRDEGKQWPLWSPGAHIDLFLPDEVVRQYSLAGSPSDREVLTVAVLREPDGRGGSVWLHENAVEGSTLLVRGPRNHFELAVADRYQFVAAGIGITPLLPMIEEAQRKGAEWELVYCGRSRNAMAYLDRLEEYEDRVTIRPRDEFSRIDFRELFTRLPEDTQTYICGPEQFLDAAEEKAREVGIRAPRFERFTPRQIDYGENTAFDVEVASDGRVLQVPADKTILEVLVENDIPVISSCAEGTCGTCETGVISGEPEHRDSVLSEEDQASGEFMMVCCSRSRSLRVRVS